MKGFYLRYKFYKKSKLVLERIIYKRGAMWQRIEANFLAKLPEKVWLSVHYGTGMLNAGVYNNIGDLKMAYLAFTDKTLMEEVILNG